MKSIFRHVECVKKKTVVFSIEYWVRPNQDEAAKLMTSLLVSTILDYFIEAMSEPNLLYLLLFLFGDKRKLRKERFILAHSSRMWPIMVESHGVRGCQLLTSLSQTSSGLDNNFQRYFPTCYVKMLNKSKWGKEGLFWIKYGERIVMVGI